MARCFRLFNVFEAFSCKIGDPHVFRHSGIKKAEDFSIISNLAVTTRSDGVVMGSRLGPTLANVFMCHFENI